MNDQFNDSDQTFRKRTKKNKRDNNMSDVKDYHQIAYWLEDCTNNQAQKIELSKKEYASLIRLNHHVKKRYLDDPNKIKNMISNHNDPFIKKELQKIDKNKQKLFDLGNTLDNHTEEIENTESNENYQKKIETQKKIEYVLTIIDDPTIKNHLIEIQNDINEMDNITYKPSNDIKQAELAEGLAMIEILIGSDDTKNKLKKTFFSRLLSFIK